MPVESLRLGMYVAELDRPWVDTPFLLQGFMLDHIGQLEVLCKYCHSVVVDRSRSLPEVQNALSRQENYLGAPPESQPIRVRRIRVHAEPTQQPFNSSAQITSNLPPNTVRGQYSAGSLASSPKPNLQPKVIVYGKALKQYSAATALHFENLLHIAEEQEKAIHKNIGIRLLNRIKELFQPPQKHSLLPQSSPETDPVVDGSLAPGIPLTTYTTKRNLDDALPAARHTFQKAVQVLNKLGKDLREDGQLNMASFNEAVGDMVDSVVSNPDALMWVARLPQADSTNYSHGLKVAIYLIGMGRQVGLPREQLIEVGLVGMLLDIGKLKIPAPLLQRAGALSEEEFMLVQQHVMHGLRILDASKDISQAVINGIGQHHERLDGSGYPNKLAQDQIGLYGRMAGIVDTFTAMTSPRPYAEPYSPYEALAHLFEWSGRLFHEPLVEKFVQAIGIYPVGSLVELSTGEVAIVLAHNRIRRLQPRVLILTGADKVSLKFPIERNLLHHTETIDGQKIYITRDLPAGSYDLDVRDHYQARMPV